MDLDHPFIESDSPTSDQEHVLQLMHRKAYEEILGLIAGKRVLDLGCNVGYGLNLLSARAHSIEGLDVSPTLIDEARRRYPGLSFRVFDGREIPYQDAHFEVVVSFQVIEHIDDVPAYLSEISRVLSPGGQAVFTTPNARIRLDPGMKPWNRHHVREFTPVELRDALAAVFATVELRGMFAVDEIYNTERERCARARNTARLTRRLPAPLVSVLRLLRTNKAPAKAEPYVPRHSTRDLHYRAEDLDESIDLMAIASKGKAGAADWLPTQGDLDLVHTP